MSVSKRSATRTARRKGVTWGRPLWSGIMELPLVTRRYRDFIAHWFGSGLLQVEWHDLPVLFRVPLEPRYRGDGWGVSRQAREEIVMAVRKIVAQPLPAAEQGGTVAEVSEYPNIIEYLTTAKYDDGSARTTSVLIVVCDGPQWRVCLTDKDNGRTLWKTGSSILEALTAIELALMEDDPTQWRKSAGPPTRGKKRT